MQLRICPKCAEVKKKLVDRGWRDGDIYDECNNYFTDRMRPEKTKAEAMEYMYALIDAAKEEGAERKLEIGDEVKAEAQLQAERIAKMKAREDCLLTTGYNFEGYAIIKYRGVVCAETVLGTGPIAELKASFSDFFGIENKAFSEKLQDARNATVDKLITKAFAAGANALIAVNFVHTMFANNMIGIVVTGTAVTINKID